MQHDYYRFHNHSLVTVASIRPDSRRAGVTASWRRTSWRAGCRSIRRTASTSMPSTRTRAVRHRECRRRLHAQRGTGGIDDGQLARRRARLAMSSSSRARSTSCAHAAGRDPIAYRKALMTQVRANARGARACRARISVGRPASARSGRGVAVFSGIRQPSRRGRSGQREPAGTGACGARRVRGGYRHRGESGHRPRAARRRCDLRSFGGAVRQGHRGQGPRATGQLRYVSGACGWPRRRGSTCTSFRAPKSRAVSASRERQGPSRRWRTRCSRHRANASQLCRSIRLS